MRRATSSSTSSSSLSAKTSARSLFPMRSRWSTSSPRPAAARSCAACSRPRSWGYRSAKRRRSKTKGRRGKENEERKTTKQASARTLESAARRSQGHGPRAEGDAPRPLARVSSFCALSRFSHWLLRLRARPARSSAGPDHLPRGTQVVLNPQELGHDAAPPLDVLVGNKHPKAPDAGVKFVERVELKVAVCHLVEAARAVGQAGQHRRLFQHGLGRAVDDDVVGQKALARFGGDGLFKPPAVPGRCVVHAD